MRPMTKEEWIKKNKDYLDKHPDANISELYRQYVNMCHSLI